jgi:hypothetical protein
MGRAAREAERKRREAQAAAQGRASGKVVPMPGAKGQGKRTRKLTAEEVLAVRVVQLENEVDALRVEAAKYLDQVVALKRELLQAQANQSARARARLVKKHGLPKEWTSIEDGDEVTIEWTEAAEEPVELPPAPPAKPLEPPADEELDDEDEPPAAPEPAQPPAAAPSA